MSEQIQKKADLVLAGGGLASCLLALRLTGSGLSVIIIESGAEICGNHTWSFHETDLNSKDRNWVLPLAQHRWAGQKVKFPKFERQLSTGYASISSQGMRKAIHDADHVDVLESRRVDAFEIDHVILDDGSRIDAPCVLDARGFSPHPAIKLGFQKFVGLEIELVEPHNESVPTIMDASVDQLDGYRFVYVLPLSPTRLLIEDTRYSDGDTLDTPALSDDVRQYAEMRGWMIKDVIRQEDGVLPVTLAEDIARFWQDIPDNQAPIGMRAALSHPTTGYSLPIAVDTANLIAGLERPLMTGAVRDAMNTFAMQRHGRHTYYRFLNRMLFRAALPGRRYLVLQRFYKLPQSLIERFYAGRTTLADKARILIGKPPVPIHRALGCVSETQMLEKK